jgi:gluconokinase
MGVSGSGKSTLGAALAERVDLPFIDGDDLHLETSIEKMSAGIPLDDDDRLPWLHRIGELIDAGVVEGHSTIVACSALKRSYRDILRRHAPSMVFVHLAGSSAVIGERMAHRDHFMPTTLLQSQLATLEPIQDDELAIVVDIGASPEEISETVVTRLGELLSPQ